MKGYERIGDGPLDDSTERYLVRSKVDDALEEEWEDDERHQDSLDQEVHDGI